MAQSPPLALALSRPGPVLRVVLGSLFLVWLVFALAMNWGDVSAAPFLALTASADGILHGQLWRLVTAPWLHAPDSVGHIASALIGLYFLTPSLESAWPKRRLIGFLAWAAILPYALQAGLAAVLPLAVTQKLVPEYPFGAMPVVEAVAIAWAFSFRGRTVHLFFVLPVTSTGLVVFVIGFSLLSLIAGQTPPSGHLSLFAAMAIGYLLGGGTPSPAQRWLLQRRLRGLEREVELERRNKRKRAAAKGLRVIPGGSPKGDDKKLLH